MKKRWDLSVASVDSMTPSSTQCEVAVNTLPGFDTAMPWNDETRASVPLRSFAVHEPGTASTLCASSDLTPGPCRSYAAGSVSFNERSLPPNATFISWLPWHTPIHGMLRWYAPRTNLISNSSRALSRPVGCFCVDSYKSGWISPPAPITTASTELNTSSTLSLLTSTTLMAAPAAVYWIVIFQKKNETNF